MEKATTASPTRVDLIHKRSQRFLRPSHRGIPDKSQAAAGCCLGKWSLYHQSKVLWQGKLRWYPVSALPWRERPLLILPARQRVHQVRRFAWWISQEDTIIKHIYILAKADHCMAGNRQWSSQDTFSTRLLQIPSCVSIQPAARRMMGWEVTLHILQHTCLPANPNLKVTLKIFFTVRQGWDYTIFPEMVATILQTMSPSGSGEVGVKQKSWPSLLDPCMMQGDPQTCTLQRGSRSGSIQMYKALKRGKRQPFRSKLWKLLQLPKGIPGSTLNKSIFAYAYRLSGLSWSSWKPCVGAKTGWF